MYADDLVVIAETEDGLINGLNEWKDNMENKGVRGNKVSWYPVLSKFISYITSLKTVDSVGLLYQNLLILTHVF